MLAYHLMKILSRLICLLPYSAAVALGRLIGKLFWLILPPKRKALARRQIKACLKLDDEEVERIARLSTERFGIMLIEVLRFPVMKEHMADFVTITGELAALKEHLATGKGAIFATSHNGNWELMGGAFALAGLPLVGVAKKQKSSSMDRFINEYRTLVGMHITYKSGIREMMKMLDEGWIIGLLMDQDPNLSEGVVVDFFGMPTNTFPGSASLARSHEVPIYPVFIRREPNGKHILHIEPAVHAAKTADKHADIKATTAILNKHIEDWTRKYPCEWFWIHDRWKSLRED